MDRRKAAAQWFYENVFRGEAIRPRAEAPARQLPSLLRTARSLESGSGWQSRESVFLKQAKLLANYGDDFDFHGTVVRYFPTYQSLTDDELRGYFTWRTRLRRGQLQKTNLSFAFLYIYELLNQIGVADAMDGYRRLLDFRISYGQLDEGILPYLRRWLTDYVIYYDLDPALLADSPQVIFDRCVTVLDNVKGQSPEKVIWAVNQLASKWLSRSAFYAACREDMDTVIFRVLCRVADHYAARCKKSLAEQYFGPRNQYQVTLFDAAVFHTPRQTDSREYALDERCVYQCVNGLWTVTRHAAAPRPSKKLTELVKTIDAVMREEYRFRSTIQYGTEVKWTLKIIQEEVARLLREKQEAEAKKLTIDPARLMKIRADAEITRDKLMTEDEMDTDEQLAPEIATSPSAPRNDIIGGGPIRNDDTPAVIPAGASPRPAMEDDSIPEGCPLNEAEYRLLQCLLYGRDLGWVRAEGHILSVLSDSINDKLYETFLDTVMDDSPELVEDYIDELKEMIRP